MLSNFLYVKSLHPLERARNNASALAQQKKARSVNQETNGEEARTRRRVRVADAKSPMMTLYDRKIPMPSGDGKRCVKMVKVARTIHVIYTPCRRVHHIGRRYNERSSRKKARTNWT